MTDVPKGIAGLEGRENYGAVLSMGIKSSNGFPIEKDRFHIVWPQEDANGVRPHHPQFAVFNRADAEHRRVILGQLVHHTKDECFEYSYRCQVAPRLPSHPKKVPVCRGNGERAMRWTGQEFGEIPCPAEKCEYRQPNGNKPAPCKPWMRFAFRLCWRDRASDLPTPATKFTSGGWNTIKNFLGFFEAIERAAEGVGFEGYSLMGFRFTIQLVEKKGQGQRFPTAVIVPLDDPIEFLLRQVEQRRAIAERPTVAALTDRSQTDPRTELGDYYNHTPGRVVDELREDR